MIIVNSDKIQLRDGREIMSRAILLKRFEHFYLCGVEVQDRDGTWRYVYKECFQREAKPSAAQLATMNDFKKGRGARKH